MKKYNDKSTPLVSVIMPVYNAGDYLMEALDSVFAQTYKNIEVIAVDDGSTDRSLQILTKYSKKEKRLRIYSLKKNKGVGYAANLGVTKAKGQYVARMDSDDIIPKDRISKQVRCLIDNKNTVVVGGQVELVNEYLDHIVVKHFPNRHKEIINMAFIAMPIQQGAMMVNKSLLPKDFRWYQTALKTSEDLDFFFRIFKYGEGANLPNVVLQYRQHGNSLTQADNPKGIFFQAFKVRLKAVFDYGIYPDLITGFLSIMQFLLILIIPAGYIYPLYYLWRGIKPFSYPKKGYLPLLRHALAYLF